MNKLGLAIALITVLLLFSTALPALAPRAHAQSGGAYDLTWSTIDSGAYYSAGGNYALTGTTGQPDAGALSGGAYTLGGGFWGAGSQLVQLFLPLIVR
ncbi:MAG: hypothetical protein KGJ80_18955 [Chloroflexota bacterium]|nr:hypothetical protein [Chloroflexota bacterium]